MSTTPQPIQPPPPPQKPIKGTRYAVWTIAGVVIVLVLLDMLTSIFSTRPSDKQPQRPTGTPPTASSLQGFNNRTANEANQLTASREALKAAIEEAKRLNLAGFVPACNQAERDKLNGQYFVTQAADGTPVKLVCQTNDQWAIIPPAADSIPPLTPEQQHAVDQYRQQQYGNTGGASPAQSRKDAERKRRDEALNSSSVALDYSHAAPQQATIQPVAETHPEQAKESEAKAAQPVGPRYKIFEGYVLETILTNRLEGEFEGPVDVMVTTPVYSRDLQHLLIPKGTRILGESKKVSLGNQRRLAVTFHRAIMPDTEGRSIDFDQYLGLDQQGASGLSGKVDTHWLKGVSTAILVGAIGGLSQGFGYNGGNGGVVVVGSGAASQASQAATQVLERGLNQLPTVTVYEGTRVRIRVGKDIDLPQYEKPVSPTL